MSVYLKDPDATLDYEWDWTTWLATGETISTVNMIIPAGITLTRTTNTDTTVTAWLSGGTVGSRYPITCRITTNAGRVEDWTISLLIVEQ